LEKKSFKKMQLFPFKIIIISLDQAKMKTAGQIKYKNFIIYDIFKTEVHHFEIPDMSVRNIYL
jgi:hypothetical protein